MPVRLAVFASGAGTNLQALLDYCDALGAARPVDVVLVASNTAKAAALDRAAQRGIATAVVARPDDGDALGALVDTHGAALVALSGYLKFLPPAVTNRWRGAILNVHPSLLPAFGGSGMYGRAVHEAVLSADVRESGATVHFVDGQYDHGAVIAQARVPVIHGDDADRLAGRVLGAEHVLFPRVIHAVAAGFVTVDASGRTVVASRDALTQLARSAPPPYVLEFAAMAAHDGEAPSLTHRSP